MRLPAFIGSIRARLAAIIVLAMVALVVLLVYQAVEDRTREKERGVENLEGLALFAARAERERFDAAEHLLGMAAGSESLIAAALSPDDPEAREACTRTLFIMDELLPGNRFALWDTDGDSLCSSHGALRGEYSAAGRAWFEAVRDTDAYAVGGFWPVPPDGAPSIGIGLPIHNPFDGETVAYLSTGLRVAEWDPLIVDNLPSGGRLTMVDEKGFAINSTLHEPGTHLEWVELLFDDINTYLALVTVEGEGRVGTGVRITDEDQALIGMVVSSDETALAPALLSSLFRSLGPVAAVALLTLGAVWIIADRWVVRPVGELAAASDAIAGGELGARARVSGGVTELDRLGRAFNEMAETRERAAHAKDEFLGLISHELKTPITTALGNSEILRRRGDLVDAELRAQALEDIHDATTRLNSIIDNMLALARLERGVHLDAEPLPLLSVVRRIVDRELRRSPGRKATVRGDEGIAGMGGATYVEQITANLVGNAIKYSPRDAAVEVVVEREGDTAVVRVLDRGDGIDPAEAEAIFDPFYRSLRTSSIAEGVGIGLSVCKRLVEAMDGRIWCRPRPDGGSEFGFRLPLAAALPPDHSDGREPAPAPDRVAVP
jgi:signal transduction histidine kinase